MILQTSFAQHQCWMEISGASPSSGKDWDLRDLLKTQTGRRRLGLVLFWGLSTYFIYRHSLEKKKKSPVDKADCVQFIRERNRRPLQKLASTCRSTIAKQLEFILSARHCARNRDLRASLLPFQSHTKEHLARHIIITKPLYCLQLRVFLRRPKLSPNNFEQLGFITKGEWQISMPVNPPVETGGLFLNCVPYFILFFSERILQPC